jgi:hypothetical protein
MKPIVPPPHAVIPRPIATDTAKAIDIRPILLNFMRFLNPRQQSCYDCLYCEQLCGDTIPPVIVEAVATLCHFPISYPNIATIFCANRLYRLPDLTTIHWHHRLALLATKGMTELIKVLHSSIHSPLATGVWIRLGAYTSFLLPNVLTPNLPKAQEKTLCWTIPIYLFPSVFSFLCQRVH